MVSSGMVIVLVSVTAHAIYQHVNDRRIKKEVAVDTMTDKQFTERELQFVYHIIQAAENAEQSQLKNYPEQYVAHFAQMQYLLKLQFSYLPAKLKDMV